MTTMTNFMREARELSKESARNDSKPKCFVVGRRGAPCKRYAVAYWIDMAIVLPVCRKHLPASYTAWREV